MYTMERMEKETAREYAFRVIKYNIISLELTPGSMVSENELAEEMGISRTPVREALIELSKLKVVEIYPQRGSFISLIDNELVEEARFVRLLLEQTMVMESCDAASEENLLALEEILRLQDFYLERGAKDKLLQLDNEFHELLFTINNKKFTYDLISGMMTHFDRVRRLSLSVIKDSKNISDHKKLVDAIRNKDKELAKEVITDHLSRYKLNKIELMEQYPAYFKLK
ncbi:transcriptional regulator [Anaerocolumna cellulosilytica]|uniref:Transcriptional regulator n=1 Tax=Anaerocolumna cellulosilytica TaxID=433286 RepID=A0A6S6R0I5_9FIRM|nr:GntR family transcriptional regulator [Anaerocolumna cellulosilytica]MBB5197885.1 DNA-binding GntR family transcriptional regulator [Anaerocolumna cellulosilytica]BCJ95566.1 transcriptional regulator [Anaerocolumna cellulosilytica]